MRQFSVDRRTLGTKRSLLVDENGIPLRCVPIDANRRDSPLLRSMLEKLGRLEFDLPEEVTVHLDARYDSPKTRGLLTELDYD